MSGTKPRKFDALFNATKEEQLKGDKKMIETRLRLQFQKTYDKAYGDVLNAQERLSDNERDLKSYDMSVAVTMLEEIKDREYSMQAIADEYLRMFGEEIQKHTF